MTGRERTIAAIEFACPDRIPVAFSTYGETDIEVVGYSAPPELALKAGEDEWGLIWRSIDKTMGRVVRHPLARWDDFDSFQWPDPSAKGRFDGALEQLPRIRAAGKYVLGWTGSLFERMHQLRGYENLLEDMCLHPERVHALADRICRFQLAIIARYGELHLDGIDLLDDWGTESALMISPPFWREFFMPRYEALFRAAHEAGMHVHLHSDGQILEIIPDLIRCGLDALEVAQPRVLGITRLAREFGRKVCFWGLADKQCTLVRGSSDEIRAEVKCLVENLAFPEGGFIARGQPQDYGPLEIPEQNVKIMYEAFKEFCAAWARNRGARA